ncbi:MAG: hypothetical protein D3922_15240 [Candidatus Electrothrix sp. AR1]|nr:hypothetical protein [Candidatus Electrothrix sp. AR1]
MLTEVIPLIDALPRADKFELMRFILSKLSKEENTASASQDVPVAQKKDALWDIVGLAEGEDADIARQHDKYLYGAE